MKRIIFQTASCLILLVSTAAMSRAQSRQRELFDFGWKFDQSDPPDAETANFNDTAWRDVDLPHDWSIAGPIDATNPTGGPGGFFPAGIGWYRKTFSAPTSWIGKHVAIEFEGVYMNSLVWINGQKLGIHPYGYTPFVYDLTPYLKLGEPNTIAVRVDNSRYVNSRWYSGSGIYRHVWLHVESPLHVIPWGICLTTPHVNADIARGAVQISLRNDSDVRRQAAVTTQILSPDDQPVARVESEVSIDPASEQTVHQDFDIARPTFWSPEQPQLYMAITTVHQSSDSDGVYETRFGVRTLAVSAAKGLELNGQTIKLDGGCVHHDNGCLGAEAFDRAEQRKVELLKAAGFNAVRTAHNPPSPAFLDACDRLGLLVVDEAFDCWDLPKAGDDYSVDFNKWWQRDLDAMLLRDRNHPSVIMWSLGNEIPNAGAPGGIRVGSMLADHVRSLDSTRAITAGIFWYHGIHGADGSYWDWPDADPLFAKLDICGYNYQLGSFPRDHQRFPNRVIVSTESLLSDTFRVWQLVHHNNYAVGDFVWSATDYLGESGIGRVFTADEHIIGHGRDEQFPFHGAVCGDIDITGWRKAISHYRNILWERGEKLYTTVLQPSPDSGPYQVEKWGLLPNWPSWNWPGQEGKNVRVLVYSRCARVRLYLNDQFVGEQPTTERERFQAIFDVPYHPGILKTVGLNGDKIVDQFVLQTAGAAARLRLTPDRTTITADGQDLSFVTVESVDKDGNFQPNGDEPVTFHLDGPGLIAGVGSGDYSQVLIYQGNLRPLFHGRAEAVIRSTNHGGVINLTATAAGLSPSTLQIKSSSTVLVTN